MQKIESSQLTASDASQSRNIFLSSHVHSRVSLLLLILEDFFGVVDICIILLQHLLLSHRARLRVQPGVRPGVLLHRLLVQVHDRADRGVSRGWGTASTRSWFRTLDLTLHCSWQSQAKFLCWTFLSRKRLTSRAGQGGLQKVQLCVLHLRAKNVEKMRISTFT